MGQRYDLVIVGLGSGGMVAAEFAATLGLRVVAVERDRVGGDCLWTGCVPSKALLASAKAAHTIRHADRYGLEASEPVIDLARVFERVRAIQRDIARADDNAQRFEAEGVEVLFGAARLAGPNAVQVGERRIETRYVLLCTGSRPAVPDLPGLEQAGYLTSETLWDAGALPDSLVALGGGPIAVELAQAFARLGVGVTVLQRGERILPRDEPELVEILTRRLRDEGVELELGANVERVSVEAGKKVLHGTVGGRPRSWRGGELLVCVGRAPNVEGLGLGELGIQVTPRGVVVDGRRRTAVKSVYAVGDLAGRFQFTHSAGVEASRAVRNMFFPGSTRGGLLVPWCTFTEPELAHAGLTAVQAREHHGEGDVRVWRMGLEHSDRARAEGAGEGALVLVTAKGRLVGAHALAPSAGELIGELALAIDQRLDLSELASVVHVYPTLALAIQQLGGEAAYEKARRLRFLARPSGPSGPSAARA